MALPDLDTSEIAIIGFWNALDNGGSNVDLDALEAEFDSYERYSNGIDGQITHTYPSGDLDHVFRARAKDDGWYLVWTTRTTEYQQTTPPVSPQGPWEIIDDLGDGSTFQFGLYDPIDRLVSTGSPNANTVSPGDEAYYDYEYPNATTYRCGGKGSSGGTTTWTLDSGGGETLYRLDIAGVAVNSGGGASVTFEPSGENVTVFSGDKGGAIELTQYYSPGDSSTIENIRSGGSVGSAVLAIHS